MFKSLVPAAAAAAACTLCATSAFAADIRDTTAVKVSISPTELRDGQSVKKAYARLRRGAHEACNSNSLFDRRTRDEDRACAARALDSTVASLAQPLLTARHDAAARDMFARGY